MEKSQQSVQLLDYGQENSSQQIVPKPAVLSSAGWQSIHFELHQQPTFATDPHQHTMHVLASGLVGLSEINAPGSRSLDGKRSRERRKPGDVALIPAGMIHSCSWDTSAQFMVLAIEPTLLQQVGQDSVNTDHIELLPQFMDESDPFIQSVFLHLKEEAEIGGIGSHLLVDSLSTALAIHLLRRYCVTPPKLSPDSGGLSAVTLSLVKDYIKSHLHQDLRVNDLAAIAQISPYHFLRLFKQSTGVTPHQYILQCRLNRAKQLLQQSSLNIAAIASQTGFCDQSHLTRWFKSRFGVTPRQLQQLSFTSSTPRLQ